MKGYRAFRQGPEEREQTTFFDYCRLKALTDPRYSAVFHIPNENKSSIPRRIALLKAGLKKGIPDICAPIPRGGYGALYIEMKIKPNKPSAEQIAVLKHLNDLGNYAVVCWSSNEAIEVLEKYLNGSIQG